MGAPNLYQRSLDITTPPPDFEVTHSDAARHLQVREEQIVGVGLEEKALVTAITTVMTHMTMMIYETQTPGVAGRVGADPVAVEPSATGQQIVKPSPTGILTAPPMTASNMAPNPNSQTAKDGLSTGTSHLLIAAGSIGATILVVFIVFLIYRVRNGKPLRDVFRSFRSRQSSHSLKPIRGLEKEAFVSAPLGSNWEAYNWEKNKGWDAETSFAASSSSLNQPQYYRPEPAFMRPGTSSSGRSQLAASPSRAPFPPPNLRSASAPRLRSSSVPPNMPLPPDPPAKARLVSANPSSTFLPIERPRSQSVSDTRTSNVTFPAYLENMETGETEDSPPKVSRFSWTNSQAPRTPMDARFSVASSVHSVARYRSVESWVGQQTGKLEDGRMQDNLRQQIELAIKEVKEATSSARAKKAAPQNQGQPSSPPRPFEKETLPSSPLPPVPDVPSKFQVIPEDGVMPDECGPPPEVPRKSFDMLNSGQNAGKQRERERERARHITQGSDAPIFQVHPGTKVRIPSESYIPSVILDDSVRGKIEGLKSRRGSFER